MKTDLRIIKSRSAIESAFINLIEMKGFENITITEIADKAMVNRNTIYLNYGSKEDILQAIIDRSIQKYFGELDGNFFKSVGVNKRKIENLYRNLFKAIDENIELYRILLTDVSSSGYIQPVFFRLRKTLETLFKTTNENRIKITFMLNGIMGTLRSYITIASGTADENIKILTDLTFTNLRRIALSR